MTVVLVTVVIDKVGASGEDGDTDDLPIKSNEQGPIYNPMSVGPKKGTIIARVKTKEETGKEIWTNIYTHSRENIYKNTYTHTHSGRICTKKVKSTEQIGR